MVGDSAVQTDRGVPAGTQLVREIVAGLAVGTLEVSFAASFAFLLFGGTLEGAVPRAVGLIIVGAGVSAVLAARSTKVPGLIGGLQDAPAVVIAAMVAALVADVDPAVAEATAFTFIVVVGVLLGVVLVLAGRFRLTTAARSLPFTVVSGFMAGTGWLLSRAGLEVMVDMKLDWNTVPDLFEWDLLRFWLPGLLLAIVVLAGERFDSGLLLPIGLVVLSVGVHVVGQVGSSLDGLREGGWLLGPFPESVGWQPVTPSEAADADWGAMLGQGIPVIGLFGVALVAIVLNVAGLEMQTGEDIAMEDEVVAAGATTTAASLVSGLPGFHQVSGTIMARQLGSRTPIAALVVFIMCLVVGIVGMDVIALLPKAVAGGVLLTVGLSLLRDWVNQVRLQLNRYEGALSAAILASIIAFGVVTGIAVGILAAVVGFVFSYSRVEPVRRVHHLGTSRSVVDRPRVERLRLDQNGEAMVGVELVGYLFFGSIRKVTDLITPLLQSGQLRYLVVDFSAVSGLDASVVSGLQTIQRRTTEANVAMIWCGLTDAFELELRRGGAELGAFRFEDLDHAFEYVEEEVLRTTSSDQGSVEIEESDRVLLDLLEGHCERVEVSNGERLISVGDTCDEMFIVESGTLTAWGVSDDERRVRLRRVGVGSVIGEVAFIAGGSRTASVLADVDSTVLRLGLDTFESICAQNPELGILIQAELAKRLAERLAYTSAAYQRSLQA